MGFIQCEWAKWKQKGNSRSIETSILLTYSNSVEIFLFWNYFLGFTYKIAWTITVIYEWLILFKWKCKIYPKLKWIK